MINPYNQAYFDKLKSYEKTPIGIQLIKSRTKLIFWVMKHLKLNKKQLRLLDIGSGSGYLLDNLKIKNKYGYDVNPTSRKWLKEHNLWIDINKKLPDIHVVCFFDVLEHIKSPKDLIKKFPLRTFFIISIPIFDDLKKVKNSKHYRPDEHLHYFTEHGIELFMKYCGCELLLKNDDETLCGRENIMTFVFEKKREEKKAKFKIAKTHYRSLNLLN